MKYIEYGMENEDVMIFLHGGGLASWNYSEEAKLLKSNYHIIIPVLDGHSGSDRDFTSIEENASEIIEYIDEKYEGRVFLIGGLSLGGQILVEMLSMRKNICKYAIIESALVIPMPSTAAFIKCSFSFFYPLVKKHWFARLQFKSLHIKEEYFNEYYRDSAVITKQNMINFLVANSDYKMKNSLKECQAKVLVLVGGKEAKNMKESAKIIHEEISDSSLEIMQGYNHGDLSINYSKLYVQKLRDLVNI